MNPIKNLHSVVPHLLPDFRGMILNHLIVILPLLIQQKPPPLVGRAEHPPHHALRARLRAARKVLGEELSGVAHKGREVARKVRVDHPGGGVEEGDRRVPQGELLDHEVVVESAGLRSLGHAVVRLEGEVPVVHEGALRGPEDRHDLRGVLGPLCGGLEKAEELPDRAEAGVVVEGHLVVEAFGGLLPAAEAEHAGGEDEVVEAVQGGLDLGGEAAGVFDGSEVH
uniref:Uncharacterized protein n=1 Tax=Arcella intermedia TaxID=1963864 RepID=A0A6B2LD34_9EUKA